MLALAKFAPIEAGTIVGLAFCHLGGPDCTSPPPNSGFVDVASGNCHGLGLRADGSIVAWGMCDVEQCGAPLPNSGYVAIAAGDSHSLGLRPDGKIEAWGSNEAGQLELVHGMALGRAVIYWDRYNICPIESPRKVGLTLIRECPYETLLLTSTASSWMAP